MQSKRLSSPRRIASLFLCVLFLLSVVAIAGGQSGRRVPKRPTSPDPFPPAQSEPPISPPSPQNEKGAIPILLAMYRPDIGSSGIYTRVVIDGFMERTQKAAAIKVRTGKEMNRKEAIDAAKASKDTYVVWFQLQQDRVDTEHPSVSVLGGDPFGLYVDYFIYEPGTGKSKSAGHVYQRTNRGVGGAPFPRSTGAAEYSLRYAGVELAERVLDTLNLLTTPPIH
ncbi:MAG TPA: hypothetical protein VJX74_15210 [Blastocatellia bacterium]|nr:hypothetical protein [Blastocatellia bacterium]